MVTSTLPGRASGDMGGTPSFKVLPLGYVEGTPWLYARWEVEPGAHIVNADREVGVVVVGYDEYVSYAFAGGTAVDLISMCCRPGRMSSDPLEPVTYRDRIDHPKRAKPIAERVDFSTPGRRW